MDKDDKEDRKYRDHCELHTAIQMNPSSIFMRFEVELVCVRERERGGRGITKEKRGGGEEENGMSR